MNPKTQFMFTTNLKAHNEMLPKTQLIFKAQLRTQTGMHPEAQHPEDRPLWGLFEIISVGSVNDSDILWFFIFSKHYFEVLSFHCLATAPNLDNYGPWTHMETLTSIQAFSKLTSAKVTFTLTWVKLTQPRKQHSTAEQNRAGHSRAQHSTTPLSTAKHNPAQHTTAQQNKAQHKPAQHNTAQHYWLAAVWVFDNPLHLVVPSMTKLEVAVWVLTTPYI